MSEDERLAWARLVSGRVRASREVWNRTHMLDKSESSDEERADIGIQRALLRARWGGTTINAMEAVIHLGETFTLDDATAAIDALGLVLCHVAILAEVSELTMASVIDLALVIYGSGEVPLVSWADLMRSARHGLGRHEAACARLDALAGVVARAIDDVFIKHGVEVDPMQLYRRIADEVIAGRMPVRPAVHPFELRYSLERQLVPAPRLESDRVVKAMDQLREGVRSVCSPGQVGIPVTDRQLAESVDLHVADVTARLAQVERSSVTSELFGRGAVPGLAEQRVCPQCAGLLSEVGDGMLACQSQHEFTAEQLKAIASASIAGDGTG